jgi:DNA-binding NarL/FixJ family response regulator
MVSQQIKKLEATKAKVAALEKAIAAGLHKELAALPAKYGFDSVGRLAKAIKAALAAKGGAGRQAGPKGRKAAGGKRRRAVITDATRAEVKQLVEAGKTGSQIAKALKISLPSVQNIKKALGLVKARQ